MKNVINGYQSLKELELGFESFVKMDSEKDFFDGLVIYVKRILNSPILKPYIDDLFTQCNDAWQKKADANENALNTLKDVSDQLMSLVREKAIDDQDIQNWSSEIDQILNKEIRVPPSRECTRVFADLRSICYRLAQLGYADMIQNYFLNGNVLFDNLLSDYENQERNDQLEGKSSNWPDLIKMIIAAYAFNKVAINFNIQKQHWFPGDLFINLVQENRNGHFQMKQYRVYAKRFHDYLLGKLSKKQKFKINKEISSKWISVDPKTDFILDERMVALRVTDIKTKKKYSLLFHRKNDVFFEKEVKISDYEGWLIKFLYDLRLHPHCSKSRSEIVELCIHSKTKNVDSLSNIRNGLDSICEGERIASLFFTTKGGNWALNPVLSCVPQTHQTTHQ